MREKIKAIYEANPHLDPEAAFSEASGKEMDWEDESHVKWYNICVETQQEKLKEIKAAEELNRNLAIESAKKYLTESGVATIGIEDDTLVSIWESLSVFDSIGQGDEDVESEFLKFDEDLQMYVGPNGELIGVPLDSTTDIESIFLYVGERLAYLNAKLAAVQAERQSYLDRIARNYDAKVRRFEASLDWTKKAYTPLAKARMVALNAPIVSENIKLEAAGKKPKPLISSLKVGLLEIAYTATRESVVVEDDAVAVASLRALYADEDGPWYDLKFAKLKADYETRLSEWKGYVEVEDWITKKEVVAKKMLPDPVKESLNVEGLYWKPKGDRVCEIK